MIATKRMGALAIAVPLLGAGIIASSPAKAWVRWGVGVVFPPVVVAPPPVYVPPPVVYAPPPPRVVYAPRRPVWIPGHWRGPYWVPGHWA